MKRIDRTLPIVYEGETLSSVLDVMEFDGRRTVFVVSETGCLLGVITEGDLTYLARTQPVSRISCTEIMNPNPMVAKGDESDWKILEFFAGTGHLLFPVVEEATKKIVGVRSVADAAANLISSRP